MTPQKIREVFEKHDTNQCECYEDGYVFHPCSKLLEELSAIWGETLSRWSVERVLIDHGVNINHCVNRKGEIGLHPTDVLDDLCSLAIQKVDEKELIDIVLDSGLVFAVPPEKLDKKLIKPIMSWASGKESAAPNKNKDEIMAMFDKFTDDLRKWVEGL